MKHKQCCRDGIPVLEVTYWDPKYNEGEPIKVCKKHWEFECEIGKPWQSGVKEVKILEVIPN